MVVLVFFFQAEDGIRDYKVTGVQTVLFRSRSRRKSRKTRSTGRVAAATLPSSGAYSARRIPLMGDLSPGSWAYARSEERRVGKEGRWRGAADRRRKKVDGGGDVGV